MPGGSSHRSSPGSMLPAAPAWRRVLSFFLLPLSIPYGLAAVARRRWWRGRSIELGVPVISVGNLTCGGTGKTPTVEMLSRELVDRGWNPAILSRGYGAEPGGGNDEYKVLSENLPSVAHYQGADRVAVGREAIAAGADILVLDDGFQHLQMHRDLDLVLLDALQPFDSGRLLPAGLLREPVGSLAAADLVAVTRTQLVSDDRRDSIAAFLDERFPGVPVLFIESRPLAWQELYGETLDPGFLEGKEVCAFCGIGNPHSFELALEKMGIRTAGFRAFRDHQFYNRAEVEMLASWARDRGVETIVMTQKDAVKIERDWLKEQPGLRWLFLRIEQSIVSGSEAWIEALEGLGQGKD